MTPDHDPHDNPHDDQSLDVLGNRIDVEAELSPDDEEVPFTDAPALPSPERSTLPTERVQKRSVGGDLDRGAPESSREPARPGFFQKADPLTGDLVPNGSRMAISAAAAVVAIFVAFSFVQGQSAPTTAKENRDKPGVDEKKPVVAPGSSLHKPPARLSPSGLAPLDDETPEPLPESEPVETAPVAPPPEVAAKPAAPNSWRASLALRSAAVEEADDGEGEDDGALGVVVPEGTEIPAVLTGAISAPDVGVRPDLNRVKAVLVDDFAIDGVVVFPRGTIALGRVEQTSDKKAHIAFHRLVLPDQSTIELAAIALDSDLAAGIAADKVERFRRRNLAARIAKGAVDTAASVVSFGRVGAGPVVGGAADQGREEADALREPRRILKINRGRQVFLQLVNDLEL